MPRVISGRRIRKYRKKRKETQREFGESLGRKRAELYSEPYRAVPEVTVRSWERRLPDGTYHRTPRTQMLVVIQSLLGVTLGALCEEQET